MANQDIHQQDRRDRGFELPREFREYIDPRATEYRLQPALATSLYCAHCAKDDRRAMLLHEDRSGSLPDIALLGRDGRLWLYEVKRNRISRWRSARLLCQLLCYASKYTDMSSEALAQLYCDYKIRLGKSFYYSDVLQRRYANCDQVAVLQEEFARWFGNRSSGAKLGGEVARLAFLAPEWNRDAISLIEQVRSEGIQQSAGVLKEYATSKTSSRWINEVITRPKQFGVFREAEWIVGTFSPPAKWIDERPVGRAV